MIKSNFHTHTNLCDGMDTPEDMVKTALSLGFTALGFSGHMDTEIHMDFDAYRKEILRLQAEYKDRIDILLAECSGRRQLGGRNTKALRRNIRRRLVCADA